MPLNATELMNFSESVPYGDYDGSFDNDTIVKFGQAHNPKATGTMVVIGFLGVMAVIGNTLLIVVITKNHHLRTHTNAFMLSLSIADFLVGAVNAPLQIIRGFIQIYISPRACLALLTLSLVHHWVMTFLLFGIAIERYIAILHPLHYPIWVTPQRTRIFIAVSWFGTYAYALMPLCGWNTLQFKEFGLLDACTIHAYYTRSYRILGLVFAFTIVLAMAVCYTRILLVAQKMQNAVAPVPFNVQINKQRKKTKRALIVLIMIVVYFAFSWPVSQTLHASFFENEYEIGSLKGIRGKTLQVLLVLGYGNAAVNPFLYGLATKDIRKAFCTTLGCGRWARDTEVVISSSQNQQTKDTSA